MFLYWQYCNAGNISSPLISFKGTKTSIHRRIARKGKGTALGLWVGLAYKITIGLEKTVTLTLLIVWAYNLKSQKSQFCELLMSSSMYWSMSSPGSVAPGLLARRGLKIALSWVYRLKIDVICCGKTENLEWWWKLYMARTIIEDEHFCYSLSVSIHESNLKIHCKSFSLMDTKHSITKLIPQP